MKSAVAITAVILTVGFATLPLVWGDNDLDWDDHEHRSTGVAAPSNPLYQEECGSCHMAYPPGLLTTASWSKLMSELEDHFGDNAELETEAYTSINRFLQTHAADQSGYRHSRKFSRSVNGGDAPIRISATTYFLHEHDEVPKRLVSGNPKVVSFSNCDSCHTNAAQGSFNEHDVKIPGYGRWDD